jgi:flagellar basal body-associated protein FliL
MKNRTVVSLWAALALVVLWLSQSSAATQAANPNSSPAAQEQTVPQPDSPAAATEVQTFTGKIVKSGEKFVLKDTASKTTYQLDDQEKAKEYAGKSVKVSGTLDASTSMIRVSNIEPAT